MMKRVMCYSLVLGMLLSGVAGASEDFGEGQGVQRWQGGAERPSLEGDAEPASLVGAGVGAIAGALVAGPPGVIVGAAGGVLVGQNAQQASDLHTLRQEVKILQQQQDASWQMLREARKQHQQIFDQHERSLRVLADGFVHSIRFRSDQTLPEPADISGLQRLATALAKTGLFDLIIQSHADVRGSETYNRGLSETRAESVRDILLAAGLEAERIRLDPQGETAARYPLEDREGMGFDRRVEIRFEYRGLQ